MGTAGSRRCLLPDVLSAVRVPESVSTESFEWPYYGREFMAQSHRRVPELRRPQCYRYDYHQHQFIGQFHLIYNINRHWVIAFNVSVMPIL